MGLVERALEQREQWVDLGGGKRVSVRRPPVAKMGPLRNGGDVEAFLRCVVKWDGFTEADALGPSVGASSAIAFDPELWVTLALDRVDWISKVSETVVAAVTARLQAEESVSGN